MTRLGDGDISKSYRGSRIVIWPQYLDCFTPKRQGRRVSLKDCVQKPSLEELLKAAQQLGLDPILEDKAYPRKWYAGKGRVSVLKKANKQQTLKLIASEIKKLRAKTSG